MGRIDLVRSWVRDALVAVRAGIEEPEPAPPAPPTDPAGAPAPSFSTTPLAAAELTPHDVQIDPWRVVHLISIGEEMAIYDLRDASAVATTGTAEGAVTVAAAWFDEHDAIPRDRDVLLLCEDGARATAVALTLRRAGLVAVWAVDGGFPAWERAGGVVVGVPVDLA